MVRFVIKKNNSATCRTRKLYITGFTGQMVASLLPNKLLTVLGSPFCFPHPLNSLFCPILPISCKKQIQTAISFDQSSTEPT